ncbi:hypothetical protein ACPCUK_27805 [Streptomyces arboris]|uniref:hypothetical protein n=1 Tax=Streptomyces arboris TaxID=2600619 RepID=UPI003C2F1680
MTLVQPETTTDTPPGVDLTVLLQQCSAELGEQRAMERDWEREQNEDAVEWAVKHAAEKLGEVAAAALGTWQPAETMDEGCLQAYVTITPGAQLIYTNGEDGIWFTLLTTCSRCGNGGDFRVSNLLGLADALSAAGVL